ncbi:hypothetical protein SH449x_000793 [Pirellulaceae bacterium SH449]
MFDISLNSNAIESSTCVGEIRIGGFFESFECSLEFWKASDYEAQWRRAINTIVCGAEKSCLITSMTNPASANFLFWWPIYRVDRVVFIQNQVLFLDECRKTFDLGKPEKWVPDRVSINEDGSKISEWSAPLTDLKEWLKI